MTDFTRVACAVTLPGVTHLAPIWLMRDGTWQIDRSLSGPEQQACRAWIDDCGPAFRHHHQDLLDQKEDNND